MGTKALANTEGIPHSGIRRFYTIENEVDLNGVADTDVVQAVAVPAMTKILGVVTKIVTASNKVSTCNIGITGGDTDGFAASTDLAAAADTVVDGAGAYVGAGGYLSVAADTIDLLMSVTAGPITAGKVLVKALCVDMSDH